MESSSEYLSAQLFSIHDDVANTVALLPDVATVERRFPACFVDIRPRLDTARRDERPRPRKLAPTLKSVGCAGAEDGDREGAHECVKKTCRLAEMLKLTS